MKFGKDFIFGTAISAFQTEMGDADTDFNGTDWYEWSNNKKIIEEGLVSGDKPQNGDNFLKYYDDDLKRCVDLGTDSIRLSIEWGRIFRNDTSDIKVDYTENENKEPLYMDIKSEEKDKLNRIADKNSVNLYKNILKKANDYGLKVFLTVYHWPLPLWLHDPVQCHENIYKCNKKGWLDIKTVNEYGKYVSFVSETFSDYVYSYETINEPEIIATQGYLFGTKNGFPPGISNINLAFKVERNLAFAHNLAYKELKKTGIETGIGTAPQYFFPINDDPKTIEVVEKAKYYNNEWVLNAALNGEFDNNLSGIPDEKIKDFGGADYVGIDYYQRIMIKYAENKEFLPMEIEKCKDCTDFGWDIYPKGIRNVVNWIYNKYKKPLYILENGIADANDIKRSRYIKEHLEELSKAISIDKIPIKGYYHWSLMDNYEWASGFKMRFGLYEVDYNTKKRTKRKSAEVYEKICKSR